MTYPQQRPDLPQGPPPQPQPVPYQYEYGYAGPGPGGPVGPVGPVKQKPQRNTALLAVVAVVGTLILVFGGLTLWKQMRDVPQPPVALGEDQLAAAFEEDSLASCDLGAEFWESVGVHDVNADRTRCTGYITSQEGLELPVRMSVEAGRSTETDFVPIIHTSNMWLSTKDPEADLPESLEEMEWRDGGGMRCDAFSTEPALERVRLSIAGPCEPLVTIARQLDNVAEQYAFRPGAKGLFDFSTPAYVSVNPEAPSAVSEFYAAAAAAALPPGERIEVPNQYFDGSTFTAMGLYNENDTYKLQGEFFLGAGRSSGTQTFYTPEEFTVIYPDGSRVAMKREGIGQMRTEETAPLNAETVSDAPAAEHVLLFARNTDETVTVWQF